MILSSAAPIKRTAVERQVNLQIVFLFVLLLALSIGSTVGSSIRSVRLYIGVSLRATNCCFQWVFASKQWYLLEGDTLSGRAKGFIEGEGM